MTPQEWIQETGITHVGVDGERDGEEFGYHLHEFVVEGAQHLAAALEEIAELRKAAEWIVECEKWDEGSRLLNEKALAQARIECKRASEQASGELPPNLEEWMMLVARKQGRDESAAEIARLKAQLSQAERVVVPELDSGISFWKHANGTWYCWDGWKNTEMTRSRILKDGEVAVQIIPMDSAPKTGEHIIVIGKESGIGFGHSGPNNSRQSWADVVHWYPGWAEGGELPGWYSSSYGGDQEEPFAEDIMRGWMRIPESINYAIEDLDALRAQGKEKP